MELRYLGDQKAIRQDKYKDWKEYAKKVNDLKKSYWNLLGLGKFIDEEIFMNDNKAITSKAFISQDGKMAIALWNDSGKKQKVKIEAQGYTLIEAATIDDKSKDMLKQLDDGQIAILLYEKN
jgi:endo-1,4-beta-D-glucanase Y